MQLVVPKAELAKLLARAAAVAAAKSPNAALCAVMLEASTDRLSVRATDGFLGVQASTPAEVKAPGTVAVDARRIAEIVKALPGLDVTLKLVGAQLELRAGKSRFKVAVVDGADFPALPRIEDAAPVATLPTAELLRGLAQGAYALEPSDSRPELNVAFLDASQGFLRVVSLDGRRLALAEIELDCASAQLSIPVRGVAELKKLCEGHKGGEIRIATVDRQAFFAAGDVVLNVLTQEAGFPPYKKLCPVAHEQSVTIHREMLVDVLRRVALVAKGKDATAVRLAFSTGQLRVSAADAVSEGEDLIDCDATFDLELYVNPVFLAEAADAVSENEVRLEMSGEFGPIVVSPMSSSECKAVCMTIRK